MKPGPRNLLTDVTGLLVGNAEDQDLKSGVTVVTGDVPFVAGVHVMGGAPGTRETDLLAPDKTVAGIDALVLSGGSAFGLAACDGVVDGLRRAKRGFPVGPVTVPIVPGAILFDMVNGGNKGWADNPYPKLGRAALDAAGVDFNLGSTGAGTGALDSCFKGGLGSASVMLDSGRTVAALMAVNPVGSVTTPGGNHFWAAPHEMGDEFGGVGPDSRSNLVTPDPSQKMAMIAAVGQDRANTTIGVIATDAALTKAQCHRLAVAAHDGIARAIQPAHSPFDGDLLFAVSTGAGPVVDDMALFELGHAASVCVARAIARGVFEATPRPGDVLPTWNDRKRKAQR